jgi:hypothetical protein
MSRGLLPIAADEMVRLANHIRARLRAQGASDLGEVAE